MSFLTSSIRTFSRPAERRLAVAVAALVAVCAAMVLSVGVGPVYIGPGAVLNALVDAVLGRAEGTSAVIVNQVRLPRILVGAMAGASLAMSGAILQGVTRNPLADPHIFGISAGAGLVAVTGLVFYPTLPAGTIQPLAFAGGLAGGGAAYAMAWRGGVSPTRLALAGIAVTSMLTAVTSGILVTSSFSAQIGLRWLIGGFSWSTWEQFHLLWPYFLGGAVVAIAMSRQLNVLALGDDIAAGLGQHVQRTRLALTGVAALLASAAVSIAGLIGFVGLIVPHVVRLIIGNDYRFLIPTSALFGALLIVVADMAARTVFDPHELPVGVFTAVMGGPVFVLLVRRRT